MNINKKLQSITPITPFKGKKTACHRKGITGVWHRTPPPPRPLIPIFKNLFIKWNSTQNDLPHSPPCDFVQKAWTPLPPSSGILAKFCATSIWFSTLWTFVSYLKSSQKEIALFPSFARVKDYLFFSDTPTSPSPATCRRPCSTSLDTWCMSFSQIIPKVNKSN
jgi:hypothetical protein